MDVVNTRKRHEKEAEKHRKHRKANARNKGREKMRTFSFQKGADTYKKLASKKGQGRAKKEKGRTCPKGIPMNSCGKGWARIHWELTDDSMKEGFAFSYLWIRT